MKLVLSGDAVRGATMALLILVLGVVDMCRKLVYLNDYVLHFCYIILNYSYFISCICKYLLINNCVNAN